ncbi:MAG: hypothetical protein ABJM06_00445 [Gilvibacter sp.]
MKNRLLKIGKYASLVVVVVFLYAFSNARNATRKLSEIQVQFEGNNTALITKSMVNKLLIQSDDSLETIGKEILDLNQMEGLLNRHPMIKNAEIYLTVDGRLGATVLQRKPIARVSASPSYYIDSDGTKMPLSQVHTVRVPLVSGVDEDNLTEVQGVLKKLNEDAFMNKHIVGIHVNTDKSLRMYMRKHDLIVEFGKPENIENKFRNFKAFYQKTLKDKSLAGYSKINLTVNSQVVATKK